MGARLVTVLEYLVDRQVTLGVPQRLTVEPYTRDFRGCICVPVV